MNIKFSKYHGLGNSFVILDEGYQDLDLSKLAQDICNQNTGIGADGLIVAKTKPFEMVFFNQDGSRAPMCGNGIRCLNQYLFDQKLNTTSPIEISTLAGSYYLNFQSEGEFLTSVSMGQPSWDPKLINVKSESQIFDYELKIEDSTHKIFSLWTGTVHTVLFVDSLNSDLVKTLGKKIHDHPLFNEKTNVNFVQKISDDEIKILTYERGVGPTLACGTGAVASAFVFKTLTQAKAPEIKVSLPLGYLKIKVDNVNDLLLIGPSKKIGEGVFEWKK